MHIYRAPYNLSDKVNGILTGLAGQEKIWVTENYKLIVLLKKMLYEKRL